MLAKRAPVVPGEGLAACHQGAVVACTFGPRLSWAASGGWDGQVLLWDVESGQATDRWQVGPKAISALCAMPGGTRLLTGDMEGRFGSWLLPSHHQESLELAHQRPISSISVTPQGRSHATSSWDATVRLTTISPEEGPNVRTLRGHGDVVVGCRFWPDAKTLISWSRDGTIRVWEVARGFQIGQWDLPRMRPLALEIAPNGKALAASTEDGTLFCWDLTQPGRQAYQLSCARAVRGCFFSTDAELILAVTAQGNVHFLSVPDLQEVLPANKTKVAVQSAAYAASGEALALGGEDGSLYFHPVPDAVARRDLYVAPVETLEERASRTLLGRIRGSSSLKRILRCSCPVCGRLFELGESLPGPGLTCTNCQRGLRFADFTLKGN
ncbi:MAG TPA: hypothetical protein PKD86_02570 [Gemmatales bacterium]|nr:hypothetical protein [Gemmatales bacterium]HMP58215.1 hypothetical protein [Gemmatales bacterium]